MALWLLAWFGLEFKINIISPPMVEGAAPLPLVDGAVDESSVASWFLVPLQGTGFHLCPPETFWTVCLPLICLRRFHWDVSRCLFFTFVPMLRCSASSNLKPRGLCVLETCLLYVLDNLFPSVFSVLSLSGAPKVRHWIS